MQRVPSGDHGEPDVKARESHSQVETTYPDTAPGILRPASRSSTATPSATFTTQVSRLSTTDEPPAEEAHEASDDDDRGDGDASYGTRAEVGACGDTGPILQLVARYARRTSGFRSP